MTLLFSLKNKLLYTAIVCRKRGHLFNLKYFIDIQKLTTIYPQKNTFQAAKMNLYDILVYTFCFFWLM